jgi:hypothetical protein
MENQAGFNRFAEADFIGKQNSWRQPLGYFRRDIELMGYQIDSASDKTPDFRLAALELMIERFDSKVEDVGGSTTPANSRSSALLNMMRSLSSVSHNERTPPRPSP